MGSWDLVEDVQVMGLSKANECLSRRNGLAITIVSPLPVSVCSHVLTPLQISTIL